MATNIFAAFAELWVRAFDFSGRSRRMAYWGAILVDALLTALLSLSAAASLVYLLLSVIPALSLHIRRLHDSGRSAWWMLVALIPYAGGVILLVLMLFDSEGANRYGPSPKYGGIPF